MDKIQSAVSLALRDTETCTAATEVWEDSQTPAGGSQASQRRVLAVVTHSSAGGGSGSIEGDIEGGDVVIEEGW